jgi:hypothetical protein
VEANLTCLIRAVVDHVPCVDIGHDYQTFAETCQVFTDAPLPAIASLWDIVPLRDNVRGGRVNKQNPEISREAARGFAFTWSQITSVAIRIV